MRPLLLSVGQVGEAGALLVDTNATATALRLMADTVQTRDTKPLPSRARPRNALVNSYVFANPGSIEGALVAARKKRWNSRPTSVFAGPGWRNWNSVRPHGRGFHGARLGRFFFPAQCPSLGPEGISLACEQLTVAGRAGRL